MSARLAQKECSPSSQRSSRASQREIKRVDSRCAEGVHGESFHEGGLLIPACSDMELVVRPTALRPDGDSSVALRLIASCQSSVIYDGMDFMGGRVVERKRKRVALVERKMGVEVKIGAALGKP